MVYCIYLHYNLNELEQSPWYMGRGYDWIFAVEFSPFIVDTMISCTWFLLSDFTFFQFSRVSSLNLSTFASMPGFGSYLVTFLRKAMNISGSVVVGSLLPYGNLYLLFRMLLNFTYIALTFFFICSMTWFQIRDILYKFFNFCPEMMYTVPLVEAHSTFSE